MWPNMDFPLNPKPTLLVHVVIEWPINAIRLKVPLGAVHKLHLQDSSFFWPPTLLRLHFLWYECLQKVANLDHLPTSSCKRSLWTAPYLKIKNLSKNLNTKSLLQDEQVCNEFFLKVGN